MGFGFINLHKTPLSEVTNYAILYPTCIVAISLVTLTYCVSSAIVHDWYDPTCHKIVIATEVVFPEIVGSEMSAPKLQRRKVLDACVCAASPACAIALAG